MVIPKYGLLSVCMAVENKWCVSTLLSASTLSVFCGKHNKTQSGNTYSLDLSCVLDYVLHAILDCMLEYAINRRNTSATHITYSRLDTSALASATPDLSLTAYLGLKRNKTHGFWARHLKEIIKKVTMCN